MKNVRLKAWEIKKLIRLAGLPSDDHGGLTEAIKRLEAAIEPPPKFLVTIGKIKKPVSSLVKAKQFVIDHFGWKGITTIKFSDGRLYCFGDRKSAEMDLGDPDAPFIKPIKLTSKQGEEC